jgi:hypothetical protein
MIFYLFPPQERRQNTACWLVFLPDGLTECQCGINEGRRLFLWLQQRVEIE